MAHVFDVEHWFSDHLFAVSCLATLCEICIDVAVSFPDTLLVYCEFRILTDFGEDFDRVLEPDSNVIAMCFIRENLEEANRVRFAYWGLETASIIVREDIYMCETFG